MSNQHPQNLPKTLLVNLLRSWLPAQDPHRAPTTATPKDPAQATTMVADSAQSTVAGIPIPSIGTHPIYGDSSSWEAAVVIEAQTLRAGEPDTTINNTPVSMASYNLIIGDGSAANVLPLVTHSPQVAPLNAPIATFDRKVASADL